MLDPHQDAEQIHNAVKGIGTDEHTLINIIGRRPNYHLQRVREEYEKKYHKDLLKVIEHETSYNFKHLLVHILKSRAENRADILYKAMKGLGTNEHALIDIILTTDSFGIQQFNDTFKHKYKTTLSDFVKGDTSGSFEKILIYALDARRSYNIEYEKIDSDVGILYKAGEGRWGTDEKSFIDILTTRSHEHLVQVAQRYKELHKKSLEEAIKSETSGWFKTALLCCIELPQTYWARRVHDAIKGLGTNDSLLVRCFSECCKPLLFEVAKEYKRIYNVSIEDDIKGDTSGDYCKLLLAMVDLPEGERRHYVMNTVW